MKKALASLAALAFGALMVAPAMAATQAPAPLASIQSLHDEFVPAEETRGILDRARGPRRLWTIDATDHCFSGAREELERSLGEAIAWIGAGAP